MSAAPALSRDAAEAAAAQPLPVSAAGRWRGLVLPVAAVLLWWLLSHAGLVNSALLVPPEKVLATAVEQISGGKLWRALGASLAREFTGFAIGTLAGLLLGAALGVSRIFNRLAGPSFNTFKQISLFAWIPLISVWFGLGDTAKVAFLSLAALVPVVVNTCDGISQTPPALLEVARVYGYTRWQTFRQVVLPAAAPAIFTGIYLALIYSGSPPLAPNTCWWRAWASATC